MSIATWGELCERLQVPSEGSRPLTTLRNPDIEPMPPLRRNWGFWSYFGYWGIPNMTIWTWSTGLALVSLGLSFSYIMGAVTFGNAVICAYTCLSSQPGARYYIGFPVSQRMVLGIRGSWLAVVIRIVLSVVFYGLQAWLGGVLVAVMLCGLSRHFLDMRNTFGASAHMSARDFVGFVLFHAALLLFFGMQPEKINTWLVATCVLTFGAFMAMLGVCIRANGGSLGTLVHEAQVVTPETGWIWLYAVAIWYGALSPDILNHNDYSRFASSAPKMHWGIVVAVFSTGTFVPLASLLCASVTQATHGEAIWLPTNILLRWLHADYSASNRAMAVIFGFTFALSQMTFNVAVNGLAGGMEIAGLCPKYINIVRGALLTAVLSWAVQPWRFYNTSSVFISVMSSFGAFTTPFIAIAIADFLCVRRATVPLLDLYSEATDGTFFFTHGVNFRAVLVWVVSAAVSLPGMVKTVTSANVPVGLVRYYEANAIFTFVCPFAAYLCLCWLFPPQQGTPDSTDVYGVFTPAERAKLGMDDLEEPVLLADTTRCSE